MVESSDEVGGRNRAVPPDKESSKCPMCGAEVPRDAVECPDCGEPFSPEAFVTAADKKPRTPRLMFIVGIILVLIGGPGVALGSWLHDLLKVPIGDYDNFDSFGWANRLVSTVGIIILVIGIILLILSLPKAETEEDEPGLNKEDETILAGDQGG